MTRRFPQFISTTVLAGGGPPALVDVINADRLNGYNFAARALELGWNGVDLLNFTVTLKAGIWVVGRIGFDTGIYPLGSNVSLLVEATAFWGGIGGKGADYSAYPGSANGEAGGLGFKARCPITVDNLGTGFGGGGGGGRGGHDAYGHGGGGGGGRPLGPAGEGVPPFRAAYSSGTWGALAGTPGTKLAPGPGGLGGADAGNGGPGADWAAAGSPGTDGSLTPGGLGGPAGNCIEGNSLITWTNPGTRIGAIIA